MVRWQQTRVAAGPDEASKLHNEAQAHTASSQKRRRHGNRVIGHHKTNTSCPLIPLVLSVTNVVLKFRV